MGDSDEPLYDDMTIGLQLQQFLDEWHYRVIHSNLASTWDRNQAVIKAMEIFEMNGAELTSEEKEQFAELEEPEMIAELVKRMPLSSRKGFEHFALQLQLVVSTATRVRHALEEVEENPVVAGQELAKVMEDGDTGITQQILKQAVVEAAVEVGEISELRESWVKSTETRVGRLAKCSDEAEHAKQQLDAIQTQLGGFGEEQSSKSKKVLMSVAGNQDKNLLHTIFSSWLGAFLRYKAEKDIHDKFRKQISDAEDKLVDYKQKQLNNVRGVMMRSATQGDNALQSGVLVCWLKAVRDFKGDAKQQQHQRELQEKLDHMQKSQTENTKKVMTRMTAGNDQALLSLCWQAWDSFVQEYKKNKEMEDAVKAAEKQLAEFTKKKSDEAKGVLNRMSGATESGLIMSTFAAWRDYFIDLRQAREMEEMIANAETGFKSLNAKQKNAANGVMSRLHRCEEEIFIDSVFQNWATEAALSKVMKHYAGKMDQKKNQLDAVQTMFKSFAVQLEQGIGQGANTPRTQRRTEREGKKERPPQIPAA